MFHFLVAYVLFLLLIELGIWQGRLRKKGSHPGSQPYFSVVIPFRDEEENLRITFAALLAQHLSPDQFEVLWVNDNSSDGGAELLHTLIAGCKNQRLLHTSPTAPGKRRALAVGLEAAKGDFIVFTDADSKPPANWLSKYYAGLQHNSSDIIAGPVEKYSKGLLGHLLAMESRLNNRLAESFCGFQSPLLVFGANWGVTSSHLDGEKTYAGLAKSISGDDDLLVQRLAASGLSISWFADNPVLTPGPADWQAWLRQKRRHLSAGRHYNWVGRIFYAILHLFNLLLLCLVVIDLSFWPLLAGKMALDGLWLLSREKTKKILLYMSLLPIFEFYWLLTHWLLGIYTFFKPARRW
jgi:cellulose synthase/poly-beta-1,6-N-acetylglucosamine synthase-like glycosyltransferase